MTPPQPPNPPQRAEPEPLQVRVMLTLNLERQTPLSKAGLAFMAQELATLCQDTFPFVRAASGVGLEPLELCREGDVTLKRGSPDTLTLEGRWQGSAMSLELGPRLTLTLSAGEVQAQLSCVVGENIIHATLEREPGEIRNLGSVQTLYSGPLMPHTPTAKN